MDRGEWTWLPWRLGLGFFCDCFAVIANPLAHIPHPVTGFESSLFIRPFGNHFGLIAVRKWNEIYFPSWTIWFLWSFWTFNIFWFFWNSQILANLLPKALNIRTVSVVLSKWRNQGKFMVLGRKTTSRAWIEWVPLVILDTKDIVWF